MYSHNFAHAPYRTPKTPHVTMRRQKLYNSPLSGYAARVTRVTFANGKMEAKAAFNRFSPRGEWVAE